MINVAKILVKIEPLGRRAANVSGYHIYCSILDFIRRYNKRLSRRIHDTKTKPLKIHHYETSGKISIELNTMKKDFSENFYEYLYTGYRNRNTLRLKRTSYRIVALKPEDPSLESGEYGFFILEKKKTPHRKILFRFLTPTVFRRGNVNFVFPDPFYVFNSLLKKWNTFAEEKLPAFDRDYLEKNLWAVQHKIFTSITEVDRTKLAGFEGFCIFEISPEASRDFAVEITTLADFATFAGLGMKTAMGLGSVRVKFI